jgi:hypothetical protein
LKRGFGKVRLPAGDTVSRKLKRGDPVSEQENKTLTAVEIERELREDFRKIMSRPTKQIKEEDSGRPANSLGIEKLKKS